ncbi:MAG: metal ABC transporter substrate-binding protein [Gemmatimonadota bacterium]|jgi:ABC-type Zn uptake system ZnuABC Zn-binding protein ZnuA
MMPAMMMRAAAAIPGLFVLVTGPTVVRHPDVGRDPPARVVTTQAVFGAIARAVGGDAVTVTSIASAAEDPHFVRPKPSLAAEIRRADLFVTTGLDLELWVPPLLDRAGNPDVMEGGRGYVTAHTGVRLLDIPSSLDRSAGDVHVFGNPHIHTDPLRALQIARNIAKGMKTAAPGVSAEVDRNLEAFSDRIRRRLFGDRLVDLLGGETLERLALANKLLPFLADNMHEGVPLESMLGGWLAAAAPFRGQEIICYHKNWAYFEERFDVHCAAYVEPKPGIPPTPNHVARLLEMIREQGIHVILAASYFDRRQVETVARRSGAVPVIVPLNPGIAGVDDYFSLVDAWVDALAEAFGPTVTAPEEAR